MTAIERAIDALTDVVAECAFRAGDARKAHHEAERAFRAGEISGLAREYARIAQIEASAAFTQACAALNVIRDARDAHKNSAQSAHPPMIRGLRATWGAR